MAAMSTTHPTLRWAWVGSLALVAMLGTVTAQVYDEHAPEVHGPRHSVALHVENVAELQAAFDHLSFYWPLKNAPLPKVALDAFPADFAAIDNVEQKKSLFIRTLLPIVVSELERISYHRKLVDFLWRPEAMTPIADYRAVVNNLAQSYRIDSKTSYNASERGALMWRMDSLPVALVLAQAALESGWGTSKYALEENNLFGVYAPLPNGGRMIKHYDTLTDSVRDYLSTVNTHPAYRDLRTMRAGMRMQNQDLDTTQLAQGLVRYSERGHDYIDDVLRMLRGSAFQQIQRAEPKLETAAI